ncbi:lysoplasmalogenase [Microbulbifer flavimaris]|uniref:Lysoplasmalogenase n=1 Tax=Microbulbifer flavimaris TaxID=1781068 RepID=A0ABX4I114_9GAMM|nr:MULTISPECIES: lysoplasmalogenase [Microbulbifer]KUJ83833.1 hypothetical protein AVO43_08405 [Microbulbifer sp. ZGT114]PCO06011.1 lysoplasmalogenase [Microbulbifer flavimaris]
MTMTSAATSPTVSNGLVLRKLLPAAFALLAGLYIFLDAAGGQALWMPALKAAPIAVLGIMAALMLRGVTRTLTLVALAFSALGDVLLALDFPLQFVMGLAAFLIAQVVYAANFLRGAQFRSQRFAMRALPLLLATSLLASQLLPAATELAPAVLCYLLAITAMALAAAAHRGNSGLLYAGAIIFVVSDTLIAVNRFLLPLPLAGTAIMVTYYGAQLALLYGIGRARA